MYNMLEIKKIVIYYNNNIIKLYNIIYNGKITK